MRKDFALNGKGYKGFTLIELIVTITIILIITSIGLVSYVTAQQNARDSRRRQDVNAIINAISLWQQTQANTSSLPSALSAMVNSAGLTSGTGALTTNFINRVPEDPSCANPASPTVPSCYYYMVSGDSTKYAILSQVELTSNADISSCPASGSGSFTIPYGGGANQYVSGKVYCSSP